MRPLDACDAHSNPMLGWVVRLALYTAMRQGEILSLEESQIELERRIVRLTRTKNGSARTLRHEAVSRLVERGLTDQEVAAISGRKSMQMLRRYTHLRAEELADKLG